MQALLRFAVLLVIGLGVARAQPLPDRAELRKIPLNGAVVIDPVGRWALSHWGNRPGHTNQSGIVQEDGCARFAVTEASMQADWGRRLPTIVEVDRYPVLVLTYRATGLKPSEEALLRLHFEKGPRIVPLRNSDLVCDGTVREALVALDTLADRGPVTYIGLHPHCQGPAPAVLEVLGIRFEGDGDLPPQALAEETTHTVRIVDTAGRSLAGASVTTDPEILNLAHSTETDADGQATLRVREFPGDGHTIRLQKEGMGVVEFEVEAGKPFPTTIAMPRGIRYGGIVRNEQGDPVPFAGVEVSTHPFQLVEGYRGRTRADVLADAQGRWLTPVLWAEGNPRDRQGSAHPCHPDYYYGNWTWIPAGDDAAMQQIELTLRRGVRLTGRVVGPAGSPIPGVTLGLPTQWYESHPARATTDTEGRFAFSQLKRDDRILLVQAEGFSPQALHVYLVPGMEEPTVRLAADTMIWGRAVDTAGNPLAGVEVKAERWRQFSKELWEGTTDAEGQFVWDTAPAGMVSFRFTSGQHGVLKYYQLEAKEEVQTIVLPPVVRLHGTITDAETGKPVGDCTLTPGSAYTPEGSTEPRAPYWKGKSSWQIKDGQYEARFDETGPRRTMCLKIQADGYLPGTVTPPHPVNAAGSRVDVKLHRGEGLHGTVRLHDGKPAARARLYLVAPNENLWFRKNMTDPRLPKERVAVADADGNYRFAASVGRGYLIVVHRNGYLETDARQTGAKLDLKLLQWGRLTGTFMVGNQAARRCNVGLCPGPPPPNSDRPRIKSHGLGSQTDAKGRFRFDWVPPGPGMISGPRLAIPSHSAGLLISRQMAYSVAPGQTTQVTLGGTGRPVIGKLAFPEESLPAFGWRMGIGKLTSSGSAMYHFRIKQDGTFRVEDIPAGQYDLRIDFRSLVPGDRSSDHPLLGYVERTFTIPEMPGGRSDESLGLGMLTLKLTPK
jgi:hypothetical protein